LNAPHPAASPETLQRRPIRFLLDGRVVEVGDVAPTCTVLQLVRRELLRPGTKEGCAEGDCGACTVVVAGLHDGVVRAEALNACIRLAPTLDGKALFTVESLAPREGTGGAGGALHPVQQALVDCHGSQCGFCTPGFVMSLFALYLAHAPAGTRPADDEIRSALTGNLCRCTGYRPILDAARRMFELAPALPDLDDLARRLAALQAPAGLDYEAAGGRYLAPRTLAGLVALRARHPEATLLAGGTDLGLQVTKQLRALPLLIQVGDVAELQRLEERDGRLRIGAGMPLARACAAIARHYPDSAELWERFASQPIRNAGTLGGNVANGSPIGDSMPALIALGATVELAGPAGARSLPLEDLYLGYQRKAMHDDELVAAIELPLPGPELRFRAYKNSKRHDSDISAVCLAAALRLDGDKVAAIRIACGGMAATPKRALQAEAAALGRPWSEATVRDAIDALRRDFAPLSDMRATAAYRSRVAGNLLYRFHLETRPQAPLSPRDVDVFTALPVDTAAFDGAAARQPGEPGQSGS